MERVQRSAYRVSPVACACARDPLISLGRSPAPHPADEAAAGGTNRGRAVGGSEFEVKLEVGREYWSRRGERVRVTAIEPRGIRPVHYVVLTGRYKGVGSRDGSRLTRDGRMQISEDGESADHWNDLVAECVDAEAEPQPEE
jgi:hypothetical protein